MPNTEPAVDSAGVAAEVLALGAGCAAEVAVAGAITVGRAGHASGAARRAGRARRDPLHRRRRWRAGRRAHAACTRLREGPGRHAGPTLRGHVSRGRGRHARGLLVEPARHPRHAGRRRGGHGGPRHRAVPSDRRTGAFPPPVDRGIRRPGPPGQGGRPPGHGRGSTAPHAAHPRCSGGLRPGLQGEPAPPYRRGRGGGRRRPVRRHHRCGGDRPRAPRPRVQGRSLRAGPTGHVGAADGVAHRLGGPLGPHGARARASRS